MDYISIRKRGEEERFHPSPLRCIRRGIVYYDTIPSILLHNSKRLKQNMELKHIIKLQKKWNLPSLTLVQDLLGSPSCEWGRGEGKAKNRFQEVTFLFKKEFDSSPKSWMTFKKALEVLNWKGKLALEVWQNNWVTRGSLGMKSGLINKQRVCVFHESNLIQH